jgi:hypothetical protein
MPTLLDNLLMTIKETEDEDELKLLLGLFADVPGADLPIVELTDFLLTTNTDDDLWLIVGEMQEVWDAATELLNVDAVRIPIEPVRAALRHALEAVDEVDEETDSDRDACLEHLASFATSLAEYPADILAALLAHSRGFVRDIGLDVLYQLNREPEILPFLADSDEDVRVSSLNKAWRFAPLATLQTIAQQDPEERVRTVAAQMVILARKQSQPTTTP